MVFQNEFKAPAVSDVTVDPVKSRNLERAIKSISGQMCEEQVRKSLGRVAVYLNCSRRAVEGEKYCTQHLNKHRAVAAKAARIIARKAKLERSDNHGTR